MIGIGASQKKKIPKPTPLPHMRLWFIFFGDGGQSFIAMISNFFGVSDDAQTFFASHILL